MGNDILKKIKSLRKKLDESISKFGIDNNKTREISSQMDLLINEYYLITKEISFPDESNMAEFYKKSYEALKSVTLQLEKFVYIREWNNFAKDNNYLSNVSLEYISQLDWNYLQIKVKRELNMKI